ncbi:MAG: MBOAT family protein [Clostridiaceae bacterium]|nr:MBOAT family protein [Clostridiaceae bacterium]
MLFSSLIFLFLFLPLTLAGYYLLPGTRYKNIFLFLVSMFFYAWGEPIYILSLPVSIVINYAFGLLIHSSSKRKKLCLIGSIVFNVGLIVLFKYLPFFITNINNILPLHIPVPKMALPLGISFYTFKIITYLVDVYRGTVIVQKNFTNLALYISLFPQLTAGPIVKYSAISMQLENRNHSLNMLTGGVTKFIVGLGKKVVLSNNLALIADTVFNFKSGAFGVLSAWIGLISYSLQIYFDFSGYSDMAIGLGRMFGFEVDENFNYPYISKSAGEFWRRWHISLGSFFRDYVYIPLGGSRCKLQLANYRNLFVVWFLTGLWHGASWNFIIWGLYFGFLIALERVFLSNLLNKLPQFLQHSYLVLASVMGWVFFRTDSLSHASLYFKKLFGLSITTDLSNPLLLLHDNFLLLIVAILACTPLIRNLVLSLTKYRFFPYAAGLGLVLIYFISIMYLGNSSYNPFIYFRF